jgi:hypothetical protein
MGSNPDSGWVGKSDKFVMKYIRIDGHLVKLFWCVCWSHILDRKYRGAVQTILYNGGLVKDEVRQGCFPTLKINQANEAIWWYCTGLFRNIPRSILVISHRHNHNLCSSLLCESWKLGWPDSTLQGQNAAGIVHSEGEGESLDEGTW